MKTIRTDAPTLIISRRFLFFKRYQLYIPLDGLYDVQHFTVKQQLEAAARKANTNGSTNS